MASALTVLFLEPSYPKPSISLSPRGGVSLGGAVSVWCRGQHRGMRFVLNKEGRHFPPVDPNGLEAVFPISNVRWEDGGSYSCSYHNRSKPSAASSPSDPVELVVRDPSLPRPSISLSPTGVTAPGADVTIRCQGQRRDVRFFLHKAGDLNPPRHVDPAGDGAEFHIPTVGRQHGGSYSCSYRLRSEPFISSQPSDPVQLVVADPSLPRPSISLSPTGVTAPGANVTIRCQGQRRDVRFFLHKAGDRDPPRHKDSAGDGAEFHIPTVGRQHGGSYSCSYRPPSEPFISSQPSHPVQLVVAGESGPPALLTSHIIAGTSVAAAGLLLLLLLVAFLCFRKTRANTSIDEGKEPETLEPDPSVQGLTYAELDVQVLQAKRGVKPSMYAVINMPQGAPQ
ncbi:T-cell-interacting, activating receptor on myeloid cells protein 1-like [Natator depressus]|uniref:T-cell-interacting, activating receptor on myeloid cells protein 1-like n=1 Tax=Natator depressus TaxID=27790 RepID=UPI003EBB8EF8